MRRFTIVTTCLVLATTWPVPDALGQTNPCPVSRGARETPGGWYDNYCGNCDWSGDRFQCTYSSEGTCTGAAGNTNGCVNINSSPPTCRSSSVDMTECSSCALLNIDGRLECYTQITVDGSSATASVPVYTGLSYALASESGTLSGHANNRFSVQTSNETSYISYYLDDALYQAGLRFSASVIWVSYPPGATSSTLQIIRGSSNDPVRVNGSTATRTNDILEIRDPGSISGDYMFFLQFEDPSGTPLGRSEDPSIYNSGGSG